MGDLVTFEELYITSTYHALGIDFHTELPDQQARLRRVCNGQVIPKL